MRKAATRWGSGFSFIFNALGALYETAILID
jgi:hypothetical protein